MIAAPRTQRRWDTRPYRRIAAGRYEADRLFVEFEDGTGASLAVTGLLPSRYRAPNWEAVRFTSFEVIVPTAIGDCEIPWSALRALTDPEYDAHLAAAAVAQRERLGHRIRDLRVRQNLSIEELGKQAELRPEDLALIEAGDSSGAFPPVRRLVAAMGLDLADLDDEPPPTL